MLPLSSVTLLHSTLLTGTVSVHVQVRFARSHQYIQAGSGPQDNRQLFFARAPVLATEDDVKRLFSTFGEVSSNRVASHDYCSEAASAARPCHMCKHDQPPMSAAGVIPYAVYACSACLSLDTHLVVPLIRPRSAARMSWMLVPVALSALCSFKWCKMCHGGDALLCCCCRWRRSTCFASAVLTSVKAVGL